MRIEDVLVGKAAHLSFDQSLRLAPLAAHTRRTLSLFDVALKIIFRVQAGWAQRFVGEEKRSFTYLRRWAAGESRSSSSW